MHETEDKVTIDEAGYKELVDEIRVLKELENMKRFLESENERLKSQIDALVGEHEGIGISIGTAEEYAQSYKKSKEKCNIDIEKLKTKKEQLIQEINELYLKIKAAREDDESITKLTDTQNDELRDIKAQKTLVAKRLHDIQVGIEKISSDKELKIPHLKEYDSVLKQLCTAFMEAQNRMEVSFMFRQK